MQEREFEVSHDDIKLPRGTNTWSLGTITSEVSKAEGSHSCRIRIYLHQLLECSGNADETTLGGAGAGEKPDATTIMLNDK